MSFLRFEARHTDGRKEVTLVEGERALIGHAGHCDIRLPLDLAAYEHAIVEIIEGTIRVASRDPARPIKINGAALSHGELPPGGVVGIGPVHLLISVEDSLRDASTWVAPKDRGTSPLLKVIALVLFPAAAYVLLSDPGAPTATAPDAVPSLFASASPRCPHTAPDQALSFANDKLAVAEGKRERSPFAPKEGLGAVELYGLAAACFDVGGSAQPASDARAAEAALRESITSDFRARRVRLMHLVGTGDFAVARNDVNVLRSLAGQNSAYTPWLDSIDRQLKAREGSRQ